MDRRPIRDELRESLGTDLVRGRIPPERQIRLEPLARRYSVSITPVREALTQLEAEGWVVLRPNRGFFAAPMTMKEAESIYPILATLEALAVEIGGTPVSRQLAELRSINRHLTELTQEPEQALEADRRWHDVLVAACGNELLLGQLRSMRRRAERYERAYMHHSGRVPMSTEDHDRIMMALTGNPDPVRGMIRAHWDRSLAFIRSWLAAPAESTDGGAS